MAPVEASSARELLEAAVAAFSVLGGFMAYWSGYFAARAIAENQPPHVLAQRVNEGIGEGFLKGSLPAILALIIVVWS
jgi:membrane protein YqaA with SNARE-associated domain